MKNADVPIGLIDPPATLHRLDFNDAEMTELADSIRANGIINPLTLKPNGKRFEIIAGHRRFLVAQQLGLTDVPARIDAKATSETTARMKMAENFDRSNLSPIEEANALAQTAKELGLDVIALARLVKRRPEWVEQRLLLLELPDDLGPLVHTRRLSIAAAHALAKCGDEKHRAYLTDYAINSGASAAVVAAWVSQWHIEQQQNPGAPATLPTMPAAGERAVIQLPCFVCGAAHDYTTLHVVRVDHQCYARIEAAKLS